MHITKTTFFVIKQKLAILKTHLRAVQGRCGVLCLVECLRTVLSFITLSDGVSVIFIIKLGVGLDYLFKIPGITSVIRITERKTNQLFVILVQFSVHNLLILKHILSLD